ncbi:alkaline phytoceramidase [Exidia glandulosa HHB12029]|uniref:Alkaline phytoceramidase n=1 Tax=Exidia glandulosa HHB12029 TaxID=1314781 RepID=A0A165IPF0_EXIGL|nr:alkaline phytoceramidase [Exidia glandulosa HHB12029]
MAFWGPATIDWCEENYRFSSSVAELANTLSNVVGVALAAYGCQFAIEERLPLRYLACFTIFAVVGLGSMAFHASLKYGPQLLDEVPMIICVSQCAYILFELSPAPRHRAIRRQALTALIAILDVLFVSAYIAYPNPVFHQVVFGLLMVVTAGRSLQLLNRNTSHLSQRTRTTSSLILWVGACAFVLGFLLWNLDNAFCGTLTGFKHRVGYPCAFLLEGHAYWHVLTATGTYAMLVGITCTSLCIRDGEGRYTIAYKFGALPFVRRVSPACIQKEE